MTRNEREQKKLSRKLVENDRLEGRLREVWEKAQQRYLKAAGSRGIFKTPSSKVDMLRTEADKKKDDLDRTVRMGEELRMRLGLNPGAGEDVTR